jgi:hypothetical protein
MLARSKTYAVVLYAAVMATANNASYTVKVKANAAATAARMRLFDAWKAFYREPDWPRYGAPPVNDFDLLIQWGQDEALNKHLSQNPIPRTSMTP